MAKYSMIKMTLICGVCVFALSVNMAHADPSALPLPAPLATENKPVDTPSIAAPAKSNADPLAWQGEGEATPSTAPPAAVPEAVVPPAQQPSAVAPSVPSPAPVEPSSPAPAQQEGGVVVPAVPAANVVAAPQTVPSELEAKLSALEERVRVLEEAQAKAVSFTEFEALKKTVADAQQKKDEALILKKKAQEKKKKAEAAKPKVIRATSKWTLKSAKPGTAWVVQAGSSELRAVNVGETLPGVGTVTAIAKDSSGQWVIMGTKAKVVQ